MDTTSKDAIIMAIYQAKLKKKTSIDDEMPQFILEMDNTPLKRFYILLRYVLFPKVATLSQFINIVENLKKLPLPHSMARTGAAKKSSKRELSPEAIGKSTIKNLQRCFPPKYSLGHISKIKKMAETVAQEGDIPNTVEGLTRIGLLSPNTAYLVTLHAWGRVDGVPLTMSCLVVLARLGWIDEKVARSGSSTRTGAPPREDVDLMFSYTTRKHLYYALKGHSELVCFPIPDCENCVVNNQCPSSLTKPVIHTFIDTLYENGKLPRPEPKKEEKPAAELVTYSDDESSDLSAL
ncbi:endonuclease III [Nematocida displodere]|uniref:Endonuclease III n=1 Tax=Nematocida displodere TaxID=1805483 RepID=A0A177EG76_9MICR|nr:endonuclease III [Nematocida displodere]